MRISWGRGAQRRWGRGTPQRRCEEAELDGADEVGAEEYDGATGRAGGGPWPAREGWLAGGRRRGGWRAADERRGGTPAGGGVVASVLVEEAAERVLVVEEMLVSAWMREEVNG